MNPLTNAQIFAFVQIGLGTIEKGPALNDRIPTELRKPKSRPVWVKYFALLQAFYEKNGHAQVPAKEPRYAELYAWTQKQLYEYRNFCNGQKSTLNDDYIAKLQEVGLCNSDAPPVAPKHVTWESRFQELVNFKKEFGKGKREREVETVHI
jgi:Helicase associated domain